MGWGIWVHHFKQYCKNLLKKKKKKQNKTKKTKNKTKKQRQHCKNENGSMELYAPLPKLTILNEVDKSQGWWIRFNIPNDTESVSFQG